MEKLTRWIKENTDLTLTIICGFFIILGYIVSQNNLILSNVFFTLAIVIGGIDSVKDGIHEIRVNNKLDANILMMIAAIGASIIGHFSEGAILIFIFSLSHSLEHYTENKSRDAISELMKIMPDTARKYQEDGSIIEVNTKDLKIGDRIQVPKGELIPIDGDLLSQQAYVNEASITGESMPVRKEYGDRCVGGTLNENESFDLEVAVADTDTLMSKIVAMVDEAQNKPSNRESMISRIEGVFVKSVLILVPIFILVAPFILNWSWETAFYRGMVMLTVASPCALVASASPAKLSAISRAAKEGMILRGGNVLDTSAEIDTVVFDKTGTLTIGIPSVTEAFYCKDCDQEQIDLINRIVKSVESTSTHPIAAAFLRKLIDVETLELDEINDITGQGFKAIYQGNVWKIGNRKLVAAGTNHPEIDKTQKKYIDELENSGSTIVFVTENDQLRAMFGIMDPLKSNTKTVIDTLHDLGIETVMLTGDAEKNSKYLANKIGIDHVRANLMPGDKSEIIKDLQDKGRTVLMIGDGVNDAPALATADTSIAMGSGTDVAMETSDVILVKNDLNRVPYLISLAKQTSKIIKQNIFFSLAVIFVLIIVNVLQIINLPLGVVAHEGSTILVILNGLRMLTYRKDLNKQSDQEESDSSAVLA
ncbi:MAG: heavy metal translocating P-type ATPase [Clostridiaceae bacterium]|nr:heavy metal translocating P-type ATPase [Clostridiaceae bacterium]